VSLDPTNGHHFGKNYAWRIDTDWIERYGDFETFLTDLRQRAYQQVHAM
jgi:hypothetical protein